jgi:secreted Zn-dependent insulinase-like peptidase
MSCKISPYQFVEKYKLVPKMLREKLLAFVYQLPRKTSSEDINYDDIFDDTFMYLRVYECWNKEEDHYDELVTDLENNVCFRKSKVYYDISKSLMDCMTFMKKKVTKEDLYKFRKNLLLRDIKEIVAYRFGNVGYERARDHFYSICEMY